MFFLHKHPGWSWNLTGTGRKWRDLERCENAKKLIQMKNIWSLSVRCRPIRTCLRLQMTHWISLMAECCRLANTRKNNRFNCIANNWLSLVPKLCKYYALCMHFLYQSQSHQVKVEGLIAKSKSKAIVFRIKFILILKILGIISKA